MNLKGNCKVDFEKWFIENYKKGSKVTWIDEMFGLVYLNTPFSTYPKSMKYGMYVEFFESVGLIPVITHGGGHWSFKILRSDVASKIYNKKKPYPTSVGEARTAAIEAICKLYNKKK